MILMDCVLPFVACVFRLMNCFGTRLRFHQFELGYMGVLGRQPCEEGQQACRSN
jgi:hypothetical protein